MRGNAESPACWFDQICHTKAQSVAYVIEPQKVTLKSVYMVNSKHTWSGGWVRKIQRVNSRLSNWMSTFSKNAIELSKGC